VINSYKIVVGDTEENIPLESPSYRREDNSKINHKYNVSGWIEFRWLRISSNDGNEFLDSPKTRISFYQLNYSQVLSKDSVPCS
jgi:hypothetical protein